MRPRRYTALSAALLIGLTVSGLPVGTLHADPPGSVGYGDLVFSVALSPGQLYYTTHSAGETRLVLRPLTRVAGAPQLGPEQALGTVTHNAIAASSGRLVFNGQARTYTGQVRSMGGNALLGRAASGNRALVQDWNGPLLEQTSYADLYDAKTQKVRNTGATAPDLPQPSPAWPQGPQDVDGNYFLRARADGSVTRRDWQIGREIVVRPPGSPIRAVAIHGTWVAWVTDCSAWPCQQNLTIRNLSTGAVTLIPTRGTLGLDISGGDLAFDAVPGAPDSRELRTVRLGTSTMTSIGLLQLYPEWGMSPDMFGSEPRHFEVEDELVAWIGRDDHGHIAALAPSIDPPRYLGNAIAPASFSTRWAIAVPVSKALPTCTVTIYRRTTTVRLLSCANTIGMVSVVWDGRTDSGARLPAGTYTYRVSGRDDDGYWLRHYDGSLRAVAGTVTRTS